ncbi:MAG TPA: biotin-dependent carboxyltransferase family protein [Candidatus Saccharimonadales bacterium]|nr:biotin-dependent carboxyltransferase family protein [Candidatus Saccharimonadales bacterium]
MIRIGAPGIRSTIQDAGRSAGLRSGIPPAGPADPQAFATACGLVGLPPDAAAIEVVGLPFSFRCDDLRLIAVTGREVRVRSRIPLPSWTAVVVRPGEEVVIEGGVVTRYVYVAISGGIDLPWVLGSRATYLPSGIGPWPAALAAGDALPLGEARVPTERAGMRRAAPDHGAPVRAVPGPHTHRFTEEAVEALFAGPFTVAAESDRMGLRIQGRRIGSTGGELLTCGITAGAIQVPSGGDPIVLLADHQTTGGYPIIATVLSADLGLVAQRAPGEVLQLVRVTGDAG